MNLIIMDYRDVKYDTGVSLDDLSNIESICIDVITGDEIATVTYKDGHSEEFDSSMTRMTDFFDGGYTLYSNSINRIEEFNKRKDSNHLIER